MTIESVNPANGELIERYEEMGAAEVKQVIDAAHTQFLAWRETAFSQRAACLQKAAQILRDEQERFAQLMTAEMGKPLAQGRAEAQKCAWVCDYYADHAEIFLAPETVETDASKSFVSYQPLGVVLAVMPWNFPFWQVIRFAAPALMAGNAALLKHAGNVTGCALAIEDIFRRAGFPDGLFKTLLISSKQVAEVLANPQVKAATLTGSTAAGSAVAAEAGKRIKKTVLELGGSDAYVILEDADLDETVMACVTSRLINSGQSCIAAKRFVVVEPILEEFTQRYLELMKEKKMGDPLDENTDIGPQARADLRDELHAQVMKSVELGATLLLGGEVPAGKGAYYPPTVLTNVSKGMPAYDEELFGPVAAIIAAKDEEDAIRIANDSPFGLGAAVFTRDLARGEMIAETKLEAGACFVNAFVKSDPRLPFGGVKESGYGRELSIFGIREFVNIKTVYVA